MVHTYLEKCKMMSTSRGSHCGMEKKHGSKVFKSNNLHSSALRSFLCGGLIVTVLVSGSSSVGSSGFNGLGSMLCVRGQHILFSHCLSSPSCINGYWQI